MRKTARLILSLLMILIILSVSVFGYGNTIYMYWDKPHAKMYSTEYTLSSMPVRYGKVTYIPVDDALKVCGFSLGWDSAVNAVTALKGNTFSYIIVNSNVLWKGEYKYTSPDSTMFFGDVFYMPMDMFEVLTDDKIIVSDFGALEKKGVRDILDNTVVSDRNRQSGDVFYFSNGVVAGDFGMMTETVTEDEINGYTEAVNLISNTAPFGVNVYNILVPTSSEFYAPKEIYLNQTQNIKQIYEGFSQRVMPVNVVKTLDKHSDENIYFRTDHHWTQRGAYYAYKEFMEVKGENPPHLNDFLTSITPFSGSITGFAKGTPGELIMLNNPEMIEKFYPIHYTGGACYLDMYMQKYACPIEPVYYNSNTYLSFIGGDMPLVVFTSDVSNKKKLLILKESFGNAFATWALNNYSEVYVVDVRLFNNGEEQFKLNDFYKFVKFDDLVIINSASSLGIYEQLKSFV